MEKTLKQGTLDHEDTRVLDREDTKVLDHEDAKGLDHEDAKVLGHEDAKNAKATKKSFRVSSCPFVFS